VARWKAPRDCEIQITPDEKALVAASTGRDPAFVLVWKIPAQLSNSSPIIRQQIQPAEQMTGGPITVSPDSKAFFCHQGGVFWLPSDGSNRGGNDPAPVRLPAQHVINLGDGLQLKMVRVGKGQFWMGSPANELQRNKLNEGQRPVEIEDDFYLGVHEVTQGQWQAIMGDNPSWFSRTGGGKNKVKDIADDELKQFPVDTVSWSDIQLFLQKLNEREKARNTGWRYRLPMEAEWEYACRGGPASQQDGKKTAPFYLAGPSFSLSSKQANFEGGTPYGEAEKGPHLGRPSKVGSYAPNVLGLYDMHGNVWELCDDWVHQRPEGHPKRAIRGGSYNSEGSYCRTALPISRSPTERYPDMGFRLARVRAEK
jgi:formylglycine-generating enzyme required for sulfatase activity